MANVKISELPPAGPITGTEAVPIVQAGQTVQAPASALRDASYLHEQAVAADTWTITHNLGKYPAVTIVDSAGDEVEGNVNHISNTQVVLTFSAAFAGRAFLN